MVKREDQLETVIEELGFSEKLVKNANSKKGS